MIREVYVTKEKKKILGGWQSYFSLVYRFFFTCRHKSMIKVLTRKEAANCNHIKFDIMLKLFFGAQETSFRRPLCMGCWCYALSMCAVWRRGKICFYFHAIFLSLALTHFTNQCLLTLLLLIFNGSKFWHFCDIKEIEIWKSQE